MPRPASWCGRTRAQRRPFQRDLPASGPHEAADDVEQRRLAGAVGADHADHLAGRDREGDVVERGEPAEAHGDPGDARPPPARHLGVGPA